MKLIRNLSVIVGLALVLVGCGRSPQTPHDIGQTASDEELMDVVQSQTFKYFWDFAEPNSGLARERYHPNGDYPLNDSHIITTGGTGFGVIPYTPKESLAAISGFFTEYGDILVGPAGFYDAFRPESGWVAPRYLAIDQGPIIVMIENYRTGLLWELFMSCPEVTNGLDGLGFKYK
jgi:hypothetical protein